MFIAVPYDRLSNHWFKFQIVVRDVKAPGQHMAAEGSVPHGNFGLRPNGSDFSALGVVYLTVPEDISFKEHYMKGDDLIIEMCIYHPK